MGRGTYAYEGAWLGGGVNLYFHGIGQGLPITELCRNSFCKSRGERFVVLGRELCRYAQRDRNAILDSHDTRKKPRCFQKRRGHQQALAAGPPRGHYCRAVF